MTQQDIGPLSIAAIAVAVIAAIATHFAQWRPPISGRNSQTKESAFLLTTACYVALANDITPLLHPGEVDVVAESALCNGDVPMVTQQHATGLCGVDSDLR